MATNSLLKQHSDERAELVQNAISQAAAIILGRRRVLSGIRWRGDLIVTAAEAIGGAEQVDVQLDGDEQEARVIETDLTTDIAILQVGSGATTPVAGNVAMTRNGTRDAHVATDGASSTTGGGTTAGGSTGAGVTAAVGGGATAGTSTVTGAAAPVGHIQVRTGPTPLRIGETIVVIGRTLRGPAAIWGSVQLAGPAWNSRRGGRIDQRLEFDVGFDPTFEGAAVIDTSGNLVAMAVPGPYHRVLGIPSTTIATVVAKVDQFGHLPKPYLGIRLQPLWLDDDTRTKLGRKSRGIAAVGGVDAGSPAAQAHVELGDLLLTLDGEPAESVNSLARRIAGTSPGQIVVLEVLRGGKPLTINVQIGERPRP